MGVWRQSSVILYLEGQESRGFSPLCIIFHFRNNKRLPPLPYQMALGPDSPNISSSISHRFLWRKMSAHDKLARQNKEHKIVWILEHCCSPHLTHDLSSFQSYQCLRLLQEILKKKFALSKDKLCDLWYQHFPLSTLRKMTGILSQRYESSKICFFYLVYFTFRLFKDLSVKLKSPSWLVPFSWMRLPPYL